MTVAAWLMNLDFAGGDGGVDPVFAGSITMRGEPTFVDEAALPAHGESAGAIATGRAQQEALYQAARAALVDWINTPCPAHPPPRAPGEGRDAVEWYTVAEHQRGGGAAS